MKKELPNYVFKKRYDNFYLLTEFDVIFNDEFTENLDVFFKKIGAGKIIIELDAPLEYESIIPNKLEIENPNDLTEFYEMGVSIDEVKLFYYMLNYFISDDSKLWEVYVSLENELSIIGCSNQVSSLFEVIFNPYIEEKLEQKYKIIGDMFNNEKTKLEFVESLEKNYQFSKNG